MSVKSWNHHASGLDMLLPAHDPSDPGNKQAQVGSLSEPESGRRRSDLGEWHFEDLNK